MFLILQKKRLSITHSFGSEHSDSSDGILGGHMESPPRTPGLQHQLYDKDRSSTPLSSGSEERQFVVKVSIISNLKYFVSKTNNISEDGADSDSSVGS